MEIGQRVGLGGMALVGADMNSRSTRLRLIATLGAALLAGACTGPLHKAAMQGDEARIAALADAGAPIDQASGQGMTALMWAAYRGHEGAVQLLLDRGAGVNVMDGRRRTALWYAATQGHLEAVKLLHQRGANLAVVDALGETVTQAAQARERIEVVAYLGAASAGVSRTELDSALAETVEKVGYGTLSSKPRRASDVDAPRRHLPPRPHDFAMVVGVEKYKTLPDADYAARDAEAVRRHVQALGFTRDNTIYLAGPNATRSALESHLGEWLPRNVKPGAEVFFFFAGHGAPDAETGETYLLPWDGDPKFLKSTAYATRRLYEQLAALPARRSIVVLDACFSGSGGRSVLPKGARPLLTRLKQDFDFKNLVLFSAAAGTEITSALEEQGHGIFTYYFLKGLSGAASDSKGDITTDGLYWYLKPLVLDAARRQNREQTPLLEGSPQDQLIVTWPAP